MMKTLNFSLNISILFLPFVMCASFGRLRADVAQLGFNYFSFQIKNKVQN